jgi:hypothetical protein
MNDIINILILFIIIQIIFYIVDNVLYDYILYRKANHLFLGINLLLFIGIFIFNKFF